MANKDKLKEMLSKRNPLLTTPLADIPREAVKPVDLYKPNLTSKEANLQTSKEVSKQSDKQANTLTSEVEKKQADKVIKKFASYLTSDSIRAIKQIALDTNRKSYEVLQEAVNLYLKEKRK